MPEFKGLHQLLEIAKELEERLDKGGAVFESGVQTGRAGGRGGTAPKFGLRNEGSRDLHRRRRESPRPSSVEKPRSGKQEPNLRVEPSNQEHMGEHYQDLVELMSLALVHGNKLRSMGIKPTRGLLLSGPPGTGKTMAARELAKQLNCTFLSISGPEVMSKHYGEPEAKLRSIFEEARQLAPAVIFIDEIDSIAPQRDKVEGEVEKRLVAQLLALMDGVHQSNENWIVLATTNAPSRLDPALRRAGRFDTEISFKSPDEKQRVAILRHLTSSIEVSPGVSFEEIALKTEGFVGSDLSALCQSATFAAIKRVHPDGVSHLRELSDVTLNAEDFVRALSEVSPSILRGHLVEVPSIGWDDIGGNEEIKSRLQETVGAYFHHKELYRKAGVQPPRGAVLYGPPGTGKTLLARAVAHQVGAKFMVVNGPELVSRWIGDTEDRIRELFQQAREASPCVLFFDEIDALAPSRGSYVGDSGVTDRAVAQLLTEIDGLSSSREILIVAATNRLELLDQALLRAGRLELHIRVPPPSLEGRKSILKIKTAMKPLVDVDLEHYAVECEGWTGAELEQLVTEASLGAIRRQTRQSSIDLDGFKIEQQDFDTAFAGLVAMKKAT